jgi:branched-chain amino acid transport system ATP-binding protein
LLAVKDIDVYYGDVQILNKISLEVKEDEIVSLIGANGAGKTTLVRTISGFLKLKRGSITFMEQRIDHLFPHKIAELGLVQVPEGRKLFASMSVIENLVMGAYLPGPKRNRQGSLKWVTELFPVLKDRKNQGAGSLSGGEQQMLAIGRALMLQPKLLILDEPSLGLAPLIVKQIFGLVEEINRKGTTILLVEQNVSKSLKLSNRGYILENGKVTMSGTGEELLADPHTKKAYLGLK